MTSVVCSNQNGTVEVKIDNHDNTQAHTLNRNRCIERKVNKRLRNHSPQVLIKLIRLNEQQQQQHHLRTERKTKTQLKKWHRKISRTWYVFICAHKNRIYYIAPVKSQRGSDGGHGKIKREKIVSNHNKYIRDDIQFAMNK